MMKKWYLVVFAIIFAVLVVGCSEDTDSSADDTKSAETGETESEDTNNSEDSNSEGEADKSNSEEEDKSNSKEESDNGDIEGEVSESGQAAIDVIHENLKYAEEEDIDPYVDTIASAAREATRTQTTQIFELYDIDYEILNAEVVEEQPDSIVVEVQQQSIATFVAEGYQFNDNVSVARHTLINEDGEWKISATEILNVENIQ
ncbi:hypothetical protein [Ornithinibacillus xuwenensis]|uniref:Lipoprotein n=1 Tax=Ornithinibacillus xuwenensis TaxID=3144668 RepID=A0ABU9XNW4_9BACI